MSKNEKIEPKTTFAMWETLECHECGAVVGYFPPGIEFVDEDEILDLYCFVCARALAGLEN